MAENRDIVVSLKIDTKGVEQSTKSVEDNLKDIEDSLKAIGKSGATDGLTKQMQKLNDVVKNQNLTWGEAGKTIEQYQNIALAAGSTSPIGQEAIRRAGELKQEVDELTRSIDNAAQRGQALQGALEIGTTLTAGYGALQGVMALAGQENEALMQSLVKMQAAQSVLTGIEQIRNTLTKQSIIVTKLQSVQNWILTGSTTALTGATAAATTGMKLFRLALIATGIGAIVVTLGLLIANFEKLTNAVYSAADSFAGFVSSSYKQNKEIARLSKEKENIIKQETISIINDLEKQSKAIDDATNKITDNIDWEIRKRKAYGRDYRDLEKEKLIIARDTAKEQIKIAEDEVNYRQKLLINLTGKELDIG